MKTTNSNNIGKVFAAAILLTFTGLLYAVEGTHWEDRGYSHSDYDNDNCSANQQLASCSGSCQDKDWYYAECVEQGTDNCTLGSKDWNYIWGGAYGCYEHVPAGFIHCNCTP